jgi:tetratricopeptide (TPR) repeat protein
MKTDRIEELVVQLSTDPEEPILNFVVAEEYAKHGQFASAVSFYLRCAEFGVVSHPRYVYTSLLKLSEAFETQKDRTHTVSGAILQAIAYLPDLPHAWFYLARFHERQGNWQEAYTAAEVGLKLMQPFGEELPAETDYKGPLSLLFEKAVSGWWLGRSDESKQIFTDLLSLDLPDDYKAAVESNLVRIA